MTRLDLFGTQIYDRVRVYACYFRYLYASNKVKKHVRNQNSLNSKKGSLVSVVFV